MFVSIENVVNFLGDIVAVIACDIVLEVEDIQFLINAFV